MTSYEAFCMFMSLKMHFNDKSYCYVKYNGKIRITPETFNKRPDKINFYKLSKKKDIKNLIISNLLIDSKVWVTDILTSEGETIFRKWQQVNQSLQYTFKQNLNVLDDDIDSLLVVKEQYPKLLVAMLQKKITLETLLILNRLVKFIPRWNKQITDTIVWPELYHKIIKYDRLINIDHQLYRDIALDHFCADNDIQNT